MRGCMMRLYKKKLTERRRRGLLALLLLVLVSGCGSPIARNDESAIANVATVDTAANAESDAFAMNARLGRGINLGNALEANYEGEWGMRLEAAFFATIAAAGFDSVRVPIRWSAHLAAGAPHTIDAEFLARVDWAIEQAMANDLAVVINVHHYDALMQQPDAYHTARFLAIWQQLAEHYQDQPPTLFFELLNEPNSRLHARQWNELLAAALAQIRTTNPERMVIVGPAGWNNIDQLVHLELPANDQHLIVTVHYYDPFQFTHQGAEWVANSDPWLGTSWTGTEREERAVAAKLAKAATWGSEQKRPLFLGEFGAYGKADMASRARWTAFVARTAEAQGFSWAYWEFGAGFGAYDRESATWREPLLTALLGE